MTISYRDIYILYLGLSVSIIVPDYIQIQQINQNVLPDLTCQNVTSCEIFLTSRCALYNAILSVTGGANHLGVSRANIYIYIYIFDRNLIILRNRNNNLQGNFADTTRKLKISKVTAYN